MSAASIAATSRPISPTGTNGAQEACGMACSAVGAATPGASAASAAMPQMPGIRKRQTKKKLVRV